MVATKKQKPTQLAKAAPVLGDTAAELIRARNRLGISQSELSTRSGVSRNAIMGYESGRNRPGAREIRLLCDALRITPNRLLYGKEEPFESNPLNDRLGLDSDDVQTAQGAVFLHMLGRDERAAIFTLVRSILEARHGKRELDEAMAAFEVVTDMTESIGKAIEDALNPGELEKLVKKAEQRVKKTKPKNTK